MFGYTLDMFAGTATRFSHIKKKNEKVFLLLHVEETFTIKKTLYLQSRLFGQLVDVSLFLQNVTRTDN